MKKRLFTLLICICMVITSLPVTVFAATSFTAITFTVNKNEAAGLSTNLKIYVKGSGTSYNGYVFLPDSVSSTSSLKFSWSNTTDVTSVKSGNTTYQSGNAPIPEIGKSLTYTVVAKINSRSTTITFVLSTAKRSKDVKSIYMNIDETVIDETTNQKCTISAMNSDTTHEKTCYGSFEFDGKTYYMSIKGRGNYTWKQEKKPYNITIYEDSEWGSKTKAKLVDGVSSKKWSLLANYADSTLIRNKIGYDLADDLGIGLKSRYVDLWMNGEFLGNYLLTPKTDYAASKKGYMLELDNKIDNIDPQFDLTGLDLIRSGENCYNKFTLKDLGDDAKDAGVDVNSIQQWMQTMLNAVLDKTSSDYLKYIDLDSWAKMYILQEFYKNYDVISGSLFMHRDGLTDNDKLIAGPVWDLDNALGRSQKCDSSGLSDTAQFSGGEWYIDSINSTSVKSFLQLLGMHSDFMERVYQIYNEYKSSFEDAAENIDRQKAVISDSATANFYRWDVTQTKYNVQSYSSQKTWGTGNYAVTMIATKNYDNYITNLKTYVNTRLKFFSDYLTVTPPTCSVSGNTVFSAGDTMTFTATSNSSNIQWQSSPDKKSWENISGANKNVYSQTADSSLDGLTYRCVAKNTGNVISTKNVPKVNTSACATAELPAVHVHNYKAVVTPPTCTQKGYTTHTCSCKDSYVDSDTDIIPHSYIGGVCKDCGHLKVYRAIFDNSGEILRIAKISNLSKAQVTLSFDYRLLCDDSNNCLTNTADRLQSGSHSYSFKSTVSGTFAPYIRCSSNATLYIWNVSVTVDGKDITETNPTIEQSTADVKIVEIKDVPNTISGDVNNDTKVDLNDLVRLKNYLANDETFIDYEASDLNGDNKITADDLILFRKLLLSI